MCPSHGNNSAKQRKCTGCNRFEPQVSNTPFADLGDGNRCVCFSCCRTVIVDSNDAKPLWNQILRFFADGLNLPIFRGMEGKLRGILNNDGEDYNDCITYDDAT